MLPKNYAYKKGNNEKGARKKDPPQNLVVEGLCKF